MFVQLAVFDTKNNLRGQARMKLDWQQKVWVIDQDQQWIWKRVGFSNMGTFEVKSWGVIWLWDQLRNTVIFHDAPRNGIDFKHSSGHARIYDPKDTAFKDGKISWSTNFAPAAESAEAQELSPLRIKLIKLLNEVLPCVYESAKYDRITGKLRKNSPGVGAGYTTCGSLPGFVSSELGGKPLGKGWEAYMKKKSLNGTNLVRTRGIQYNAWVEADLIKRPKPGDIYALLDKNLTDRLKDGIAHVGVIMDSSGSVWKTADMGQGGGFDGKINVERPYNATEGKLFGETNQGGGYRMLAGWVDIDKYFA
jgi:hypothetical protein